MSPDIKQATFRPRKSLGQSFLIHQPTADALVSALNPQKEDWVLEIGPGKGILTKTLLEKGCQVIAVEIDPRLAQFLKDKFSEFTNFEVIQGDFLNLDLSGWSSLKIIGNLPYNISSLVVIKLLKNRDAWSLAVLTTQREFAQRILARPGRKEYGSLTVWCDYLCEKRKLFNIPARFFRPRPKVTSTAFILTRRKEPLVSVPDEGWFYKVVQSAFYPQRRKRAVNNLCRNLGTDKEELLRAFKFAGLNPDTRAESITLNQFVLLSAALLPSQKSSKVPDNIQGSFEPQPTRSIF